MTLSLSATFAPPRMATKGRTGLVHGVAQKLDLLAHQVAHGGVLDVIGDAGGGAVGAVSGAERVVDIHVGQAGQLLAERGLVFGLLFAETGVLQQHHVAVLHGRDSGMGLFTGHLVVVGKDDGLAQQLGQAHRAGSQAELGLGAVLGLAQVAAEDDLAALRDQLFDGGQGRDDAVVVGDGAVFHGDVEVDPDEDALALYIEFVNCLFSKSAHKNRTPFLISNFPVPYPFDRGFHLFYYNKICRRMQALNGHFTGETLIF